MIVHRTRRKMPNPYIVTFEKNPHTNFREANVAANALFLTPHDQEHLKISDTLALDWAEIGATIQNYTTEENSMRFNTESLKYLGSALLYYGNNTDNDLLHAGALFQPRSSIAIRRIEGKMAIQMTETIGQHLRIPVLAPPARLFPYGFSK